MKMGHLRPDEKIQLELALKAIDDEESRSLRLYAAGKITEAIWDSLWREWQDRSVAHSIHFNNASQPILNNLDMALQVISNVGIVYSDLSRDDKKELLRQIVERVIVDSDGNVKLELRTPFGYLHDISGQIINSGEEFENTPINQKDRRK